MAVDPNTLPKGAGSAETPGNGKPANLPGVYKHKESGNQVIVMPDAKSSGQQDALVRMGFVRIADAPSRTELRTMQQKQLESDRAAGLDGSKPAGTGDFGTYDPDAPRYHTTSTVKSGDANGQSGSNSPTDTSLVSEAQAAQKAAEERAAVAEAELAALKAKSGTETSEDGSGEGTEGESSGTETGDESDGSGTDETNDKKEGE